MGVLLTGCETTNSSLSYKASSSNVIALQKKLGTANKKISMGQVSLASGVEEKPTCRLVGPITIAPGKSVALYFKEAMQEEILLANAYDSSSQRVIDVEIDQIILSSVSPASWKIGLKVKSKNFSGYRIETEYKFDTSWSAVHACKNAADAFGLAVQDVIKSAIEDERFDQLIK